MRVCMIIMLTPLSLSYRIESYFSAADHRLHTKHTCNPLLMWYIEKNREIKIYSYFLDCWQFSALVVLLYVCVLCAYCQFCAYPTTSFCCFTFFLNQNNPTLRHLHHQYKRVLCTSKSIVLNQLNCQVAFNEMRSYAIDLHHLQYETQNTTQAI